MSDRTDEFTPRKATRTGVKPLIGFYGLSGGGKTLSSLLVARGLVGPSGRIRMIDTESGRGSLFADIPAVGGYEVVDLEPPFRPSRYMSAVKSIEKDSDIIIIDSMSHMWEGEGGVLDMQEEELDRMAGKDWDKREKCKMAAWIAPKQEFKEFRNYILRLKCPLICCFRGQEKTHMDKQGNKSVVITDKFASPIFDSKFIFELLINGEVVKKEGQGGYVFWTKITHPDVAACLPKDYEQIGVQHGAAIARWCTGGKPATKTESKKSSPVDHAKAHLWNMMQFEHHGEKTLAAVERVEAKLREWKILQPGQKLSDLNTVEQYQEAIDKIDLTLNPPQ